MAFKGYKCNLYITYGLSEKLKSFTVRVSYLSGIFLNKMSLGEMESKYELGLIFSKNFVYYPR